MKCLHYFTKIKWGREEKGKKKNIACWPIKIDQLTETKIETVMNDTTRKNNKRDIRNLTVDVSKSSQILFRNNSHTRFSDNKYQTKEWGSLLNQVSMISEKLKNIYI